MFATVSSPIIASVYAGLCSAQVPTVTISSGLMTFSTGPLCCAKHIPVATSITLVMDVHRNAEDNITGKGLHAADVTDQITQHEFDRRCLPVELDTA